MVLFMLMKRSCVHVLLNCAEMRERTEEVLCRKWLVLSDKLAYRIAINCPNRSYPKDSSRQTDVTHPDTTPQLTNTDT
jgi:hypothetical protein